MTDTVQDKPPGSGGNKARLSLLFSRQSGMRIKSSDDLSEKPRIDLVNLVKGDNSICDPNTPLDAETLTSLENLVLREAESQPSGAEAADVRDTNHHQEIPSDKDEQSTQDQEFSRLHQQLMNFGKQSGYAIEDLFRILTLLKSDIQTKEIALNSFKSEQLKRLINPIEIKKSALANAYIELQDRINAKEKSKRSNISKSKQRSSSASNETETGVKSNPAEELDKSERQCLRINHSKSVAAGDNVDEDDDESISLMIALLELLDRHPLLALPRDAMYCLDYACNDISTKNYLNLKIQGLENLIDQHRRFRYYVCERLKRSEQRFMDLTLKLELERNIKMENERSIYKSGERTVLLNHINRLKESLEQEKASKQAIVITLLNELLDEREKNASLEDKVSKLEKKLLVGKSTDQSRQPAPVSNKPQVPAKPAQLLDRHRSQGKIS